MASLVLGTVALIVSACAALQGTDRSRPQREASKMRYALTGATGFIGSHILTELVSHGHDVTALIRDEKQAATVASRGARAVVVDLYDRPAVIKVFSDADGAVHTASPGDATSVDLDTAVAGAAGQADSATRQTD